MSPALATLRSELPGWTLRGTLCSLSSFYWAIHSGFQQPAEILGMMAGVALWVIIFAALAFRRLPGWGAGWRVGPALKRAAWIKFGLTMVGWLLFVGIDLVKLPGAFGTIGMLDMFLGLVALRLVNAVGGFRGEDHIATLDSFGWTTLTTIMDGALFAIIIGLIALLVLGWWRLREWADLKSEYSPGRRSD